MNPDFVEMLSELSASGAEFLVVGAHALPHRTTVKIGELSVGVIGREDLIRNKRATGRPQDLVDADRLERHRD